MKDLGMMHYFFWHGGVAECGWNLPWTREVCSRDSEEIQDDGLQGHNTPMASNLKLLSDSSSEVVDATMYR